MQTPDHPAEEQSRDANEPARFGHRSVLAAAGIGFAIGVVVTLAFAPLAVPHSGTISKPDPRTAPTSGVKSLDTQAVHSETRRLAAAALGPSYLGKERLRAVTVVPQTGEKGRTSSKPVLYKATIRWNLNPNPLGAQVGSAREDCFLMLKALYTHNLPLNKIRLIAWFRFPDRPYAETVLRAGITREIAAHLGPWKKLGRPAERVVWNSLTPHWMSSRFVKYKPGKT